MNSFSRYALTILLAYCVGILSHITYQHLLNPKNENNSSTKKSDDSEPILDHVKTNSVKIKQAENTIEHELFLVKAELEELREKYKSIESTKITLEQITSAEKRRKAELVKRFTSPENQKKWAHRELDSAKSELKWALNLTEEQSAILNKLLENKVDNYLDVISSTGTERSKDEKIIFAGELKEQREASQRYFEEQLSSELSEEQMESYLLYEQEKVKQKHTDLMTYHESVLLGTFTDLEEYQAKEIKEYFQGLEPNLDNMEIGSFGTPGSFQWRRHYLDKDALRLHLELILNADQFNHYLEQTKKK